VASSLGDAGLFSLVFVTLMRIRKILPGEKMRKKKKKKERKKEETPTGMFRLPQAGAAS
jgi:hypothetical protein